MQERIIDSLKNINSSLERKIDSLNIQNQIEKITYKIENQNSIVGEINEFYDSAWLKLIFVITILGIIIPLIVQYFQRKNFKDLTKDMKERFDLKLNNLKEDNENRINLLLKKHKKKIKRIENKSKNILIELDANTYFLQGRTLHNEKNYLASLGSFLKASVLNKRCGRTDRIKTNLQNVIFALRKLEKEESDIWEN